MIDPYSFSSIKRFFYEIYDLLKESSSEIFEVWFEFSDIDFFKAFDKYALQDFIARFEFITVQKGNYIPYIVVDKIAFITQCLSYLDLDVNQLSYLLNYDGFEALIQEILSQNHYKTVKNYRFSDKSQLKYVTSQNRYEIDVIGIYQNFILVIDAKQWKRKDSYSAMNKAANLQYQRVKALKKNPEILSNLIQEILGLNYNIKKRLPFELIPLMVTIESNSIKINDDSVPLVAISNLNSFLQELTENIPYFKTVSVEKISVQKQIL